jgi:cell division protein FtsW
MTKAKAFSRSDRSKLGVWWWTIDGYLLAAIVILTVIGIVLNFSASPAVAQRIGFDQYHFIKKQLIFLPLAAGTMFLFSLQTPRKIRQMGIILFGIFFVFTVLTLITGEDIKGAKRWLNIFGISIQPSNS